jgi:hypothetical protein
MVTEHFHITSFGRDNSEHFHITSFGRDNYTVCPEGHAMFSTVPQRHDACLTRSTPKGTAILCFRSSSHSVK